MAGEEILTVYFGNIRRPRSVGRSVGQQIAIPASRLQRRSIRGSQFEVAGENSTELPMAKRGEAHRISTTTFKRTGVALDTDMAERISERGSRNLDTLNT